MNEIAEKPDILSLLPEELEAKLTALGQPRFRAAQIFQWLGRGVRDFDEMTNLSKDLREKLKESFQLYAPKVLSKQVSAIDGTIKYLWELSDGNAVETVVMSYKHGNTVCVSSQVGCRQGCAFCASTIGGLVRNLRASEILDAVLFSVPGKRYRMELTGPMGIGVASLLWQEEGWTMTFPTEKLYMKGAGYMVGLFGEPSIPTVNIHQVAALFKGTLLPEGYEEVEPPGDSTRVEGATYAREKTGRSFTFAKEGQHVVWLSRMGGDGKPETIRYFDFREFEGVEMPERIVFERGGAKYLEIRVKKVARGKPFSPGTWRLTVPRSYKAVGE
jgi:hypothetical protein